MKSIPSLIVLLAVVAISCEKNKFDTVPQIKVKSITPDVVVKGNVINLRVSFTDKEGDINDSAIIVRKRFSGGDTVLTLDTFRYDISSIELPEKVREGEFNVYFSYGEIIPGQNNIFLNLEPQDRNTSFGVILVDTAGHRSNYDESKKILLKKL